MENGVGQMDIDKYYKILELLPGSDLDAIESSYRDLIQVWHPDRFNHSPKLRERATEKLKVINEAYHNLSEYLNRHPTVSIPSNSQSQVIRRHVSKISDLIKEIYVEYPRVKPGKNIVTGGINDPPKLILVFTIIPFYYQKSSVFKIDASIQPLIFNGQSFFMQPKLELLLYSRGWGYENRPRGEAYWQRWETLTFPHDISGVVLEIIISLVSVFNVSLDENFIYRTSETNW